MRQITDLAIFLPEIRRNGHANPNFSFQNSSGQMPERSIRSVVMLVTRVVVMIVLLSARNHIDLPVLDSGLSNGFPRQIEHLSDRPLHDDRFNAVVVRNVHMHRADYERRVVMLPLDHPG
jgi:hypothetical protein